MTRRVVLVLAVAPAAANAAIHRPVVRAIKKIFVRGPRDHQKVCGLDQFDPFGDLGRWNQFAGLANRLGMTTDVNAERREREMAQLLEMGREIFCKGERRAA